MKKDTNINIRVKEEEKDSIRKAAIENGFTNISSFIRFISKNIDKVKIEVKK